MEVPCPVCKTSDSELYLDGDDSEISLQSVGSSRTLLSHGRILRCKSCGVAYRSFRPTVDQLASLYRQADDSMYEAEMPNRWRTAKRHQRIIEKYLPQRGSLLDVGCASGAFMSLMRDAGWSVAGVEPSEAQYRRATQLLGPDADIQQCVLEGASLKNDFDLVTLWDVLEHVTEPPAFLERVAGHLKPLGHVVLNVPRIDSFMAKALGSRWPVLLAEHLCYFTIPGLRICGESAGLKLIRSGQRPAAFSLRYISYRASQHGIPGSALAQHLLGALRLSDSSIPIWIGEAYAVFQKLPSGSNPVRADSSALS